MSTKTYRPSFDLEQDVRKRAGDSELLVCGIDEVGVGALAGPVMAAAVVLSGTEPWGSGLDDSKRLTHKKRNYLHDLIVEQARAFGLGYASQKEIDDVGIASARRRAIVRAYDACKDALGGEDLASVVDDRRLAWLRSDLGGRPSIFADKADQRSYSVAAASIVAKVIRDRYMQKMGAMYDCYDFANNMGYGTPKHLAAIKKHGPCPLHRWSFEPIKSLGK
jgi:ribonuclease HII